MTVQPPEQPTPREPVWAHPIRERAAPGVEQCQLCGALLDEPASRRSLLDPERKDRP